MKKTFLINITLALTLTAGSGMIVNYATNKENANIKRQLYVLGDSLSDNGNLANIITHDIHNLNKINFQGPFYHNSFTNGDVAVSILAQKLGTTLTPAWYKHGNNYAVAGAQAGKNNDWSYQLFLNHYAINYQADQLLKDHKLQKNDEIFIEIGGNDLLTAMDEENTLTKQKTIINNAITAEFKSIDKLISKGAHNLTIANVPDISNIPQFVNQGQSIKKLASYLSTEYNNKWNEKISTLIKNNPQVNIKPFDLQADFKNLLSTAQTMGKNITRSSIR